MNFLNNFFLLLQVNNIYIQEVLIVLFNFIAVYSCFLLCSYIFNIKVDMKQKILYILISGICLNILSLVFPLSIYRIIYLILSIFIAVLILRIDILKAILMQCILLIITGIVESVFFFYILKKFKIIIDLNEDISYKLILSTMLIMANILLYLVAKKMKIKIVEININKRINIILVSLIGMFIMAAQISQFTVYNSDNIFIILITNVIAMFLFFFLIISNLLKFCEIERCKCRIEELELYNKTLLENHDKLRTFKHDYNNVVQAMGGYVISKNLEGLESFYKELMQECQEVNRISMLNPEIINNPVIFNMISNKFFIAQQKKIEMNIDVFMNLNELRIKSYELAKILGILMDNAIEASNECENKIINIIFREEIKKNRQIIVIENTYQDKEVDIIKIFEKNYSTKKRNSGIGLWEVKNILSKTNNLNLHTSKNGKYFKQQLEVYI